jgi:hypothetical protein
MTGDERLRHCAECDLDVYNFSAMSERQIQQLLLAKNGRVCARWYRRSDGTILTADCPVGFRAKARKISLVAGTALSAFLGMAPAAAQTSDKPSGSTAKVENSESGRGVILVRVADEGGAVIEKAEVTILDSAARPVAEGQTDDIGEYVVSTLKPGAYSLRVVSPGFEDFETRGILVQPDKQGRATVSVQMSVAMSAVMGVLVESAGTSLPEAPGDAPILLPLVTAQDPAPVHKPNPIRRLFSKIKGDSK